MQASALLRGCSAAALAVLLCASAAGAHNAGSFSRVHSLDAATSATAISVTGTAAFGEQLSHLVGTDPEADNLGGAGTSPLGLDLKRFEISQPGAYRDDLLFTIKLAQMPAGGLPEAAVYDWDFTVEGGSGQGRSYWSLRTMRTAAVPSGTTDPVAALHACTPQGAGFTCTQRRVITDVLYEVDDSGIHLLVPRGVIGAHAGATITAWPREVNPVWIGLTAGEAATQANVFDSGTHKPYVVPPPPSLIVTLTRAGAQPSTVVAATVDGEQFSAELPRPSAGRYEVTATACFAGNCGKRSVQIDVD